MGKGRIVWQDLTVADADGVRKFYEDVIGWETDEHDMGDYHDFDVRPGGEDDVVAGICHARGSNSNIPALWMIYVTVEDVNRSAKIAVEKGGKVLDGPRMMGESNFCVIQDPAGAVIGLIEEG